MSERNCSGSSLLAFFLGGMIGAILGMLFAPKSGKETRQHIKVFCEDLSDKAKDLVEEGKEKVEDIKDKLEDFVNDKIGHQKPNRPIR